jgi:hypothetical protein
MNACRLFTLFACATLIPACSAPRETGSPAAGRQAEIVESRLTPAQVAESVTTSMDRSVDPCLDFYHYACGGWLEMAEMPPDRSRWSRGFTQISERNLAVLRDILEEAARDAAGDAERAKIGDFYGACMDEEAAVGADCGDRRGR